MKRGRRPRRRRKKHNSPLPHQLPFPKPTVRMATWASGHIRGAKTAEKNQKGDLVVVTWNVVQPQIWARKEGEEDGGGYTPDQEEGPSFPGSKLLMIDTQDI